MADHQHVFISYKTEERDKAETVRKQIAAWGYSTWMDTHNISPGSSWADEIDQAVKTARAVLGIMTPAAMSSRNVTNEWDLAIVKGIPFIPLMYAPCDVHYKYIDIQRIDFTGDHALALNRLRTALELSDSHSPAAADPYADYLRALFDRINTFLGQKIIRALDEPIRLQSEATPDAVSALFTPKIEIDPLYAIGGIEPDKPETTYQDFAKAFEYYDGQVLLLGAPGAGKTITLLHYGRDAVVKRMRDAGAPLPILGVIPAWDSYRALPIGPWLASSFGTPPETERLIEQGKALLLLDGLDELGGERPVDPAKPEEEQYDPRKRFMRALETVPPANKILVTCRVQDYHDIGTKITLKGAVTLKPLGETQMRTYLHSQPHLLAVVESDHRLKELLSTPLLLSFFAFAYETMADGERAKLRDFQHDGDIRDSIFMRYVDERYAHESRKPHAHLPFKLEEMKDKLSTLAVENIVRWDSVENVLTPGDMKEAVGEDIVSQFIQQVFHLNILIRGDAENVRFAHLLLRDMFIYRWANRLLTDGNPGTRSRAAYVLGQIRDTRAVEPLLILIQDANENVRSNTAYSLGRLGDRRAVEPLIQALHDEHSTTRYNAAAALGELGDARATEPLVRLLNDSDNSLRYRVVIALGALGNTHAVPPLISALLDHYEIVSRAAAESLGNLQDTRAVEPLLAALHATSLVVRRAAAAALGHIGDLRAVPALMNALGDAAWDVRQAAVSALIEIGQPAVDPLIAVLDNPDADIAHRIIEALSGIGALAVDRLVEVMQGGDVDIRCRIVDILKGIDDKRAVDTLVATLADPDNLVRHHAVEALGSLRDTNQLAALTAALGDDDELVCMGVIHALREMGEPGIVPMIGALRHPLPAIRSAAAETLGDLREKRAVEPLISIIHDTDDTFRFAAVETLGRIGDTRAIEPLVNILNDEVRTIRLCAAWSLAQIGTPEVRPALEEWRKREYGEK